jgi:DNA repair exonuclease SbcCD ATPase subunit
MKEERDYKYEYPHSRYACDALDEMRELVKNRRLEPLPGLIEELQSMFNRMEATLRDVNRLHEYPDRIRALKAEIEKLKKKRDKLAAKQGKNNYFD